MLKRKRWKTIPRFLPDQQFKPNGIRVVRSHFGYFAIQRKKREWRSYMREVHNVPEDNGNVRGIVMCAGGFCYLTCAWVSIQVLRKHGCGLPIELWHLDGEITDEVKQELKAYNVECRNISVTTNLKLRSYQVKPFAIVHSRFRQLLYLDADNICTRDPTYLFDHQNFLTTGAVFWPDYWKTEKTNPIWKLTETNDFDSSEQESGQILIDRVRCSRELRLCSYFNQNAHFYYQFLNGDKDTFKFAWKALRSPFFMIKHEVGQCGYIDKGNDFVGTTMVQHDFEGRILFLHRNLMKWDATRNSEVAWEEIRTFKQHAKTKEFYLKSNPPTMELRGDIEKQPFKSLSGDLEQACLKILGELRETPFYHRFMFHCYILYVRGGADVRV